ncbi:MAG: hypothetical protein GVY26_01640 [Bacteroidetes bacterium]|nr:hypothetical protein [Bacteroidota bacterium]
MKQAYCYSLIPLLAGWGLIALLIPDTPNYPIDTTAAFNLTCDSVPLECSPTATELLPADTNGDGTVDGMAAALAATDLLASSADACPATFSINRAGHANHPDQDSIFFSCQDLGINELKLWRYDTAGNTQTCLTYVLISDPWGSCPGEPLSLMGGVETPDGTPVPNVRVELFGEDTEVDSTDNEGEFRLYDAYFSSGDVLLQLKRGGDDLNGVSTLDLVLMSKHILGLQPFDSHYDYIAADINRSGSVTVLDIIQLRKLILSQADDSPHDFSWRFVPQHSLLWPGGADGSNIPDSFDLTPLLSEIPPGLTVDFVAVKVGDLDGSVIP